MKLNITTLFCVLLILGGCGQRRQSNTQEAHEYTFERDKQWQVDYDRAGQLSAEGKFEDAIAVYQQMLARNRYDVSALVGYAWVEIKRGNYNIALWILDDASDIAPDYSEVYHGRALVYEQTGELEKEIDACLDWLYWEWKDEGRRDFSDLLVIFSRDVDYTLARIQERIDGGPVSKVWEYTRNQLYQYQFNPDKDQDTHFSFSGAVEDYEEDDESAVIHIRYDRPVKGYTVTVDLFDDYYAEMHFEKGSSSFTAGIDMFEEMLLYDPEVGEHNGKEVVLPYVPVTFGKKISTDGTFGFFDIDYDGQDELIYIGHGQGPRGGVAFRVFELDGTEREDDPFSWSIDELTEFNSSEKSITLHHYGSMGAGGDVIKYKRQPNGTFQVTDSTRIIYKMSGDIETDSVRLHYRRQGEEMVLVKKEVVK